MKNRIRAWLIDRLMPHCGYVVLPNGTWVVRQSEAFHAYCYGPAYKQWQAEIAAQHNKEPTLK